MGLLDLFSKGEKPVPRHVDPALGEMVWSEDDEGWKGTHNGFAFLLGYTRSATPAPDLVAYAARTLAKRDWLLDTLESEKRSWIQRYPMQRDEITSLKFESLGFYLHKSVHRIFAILESPSLDRSWRIEYKEDECEGMGFDS